MNTKGYWNTLCYIDNQRDVLYNVINNKCGGCNMIQSVHQYPISQIFDINSNHIFEIPKYQREYTWSQGQWEDLFDDIIYNENGYFLGTIIAINQTLDPLELNRLEIVDGQQRLTTLSLFLAALYKIFSSYKEEIDEEQLVELLNLKNQVIIKKSPNSTRVVLQIQNSNFDDYKAKFSEISLIKEKIKAPKNAGNRRIYRAFKYYEYRIDKYIAEKENKIDAILEILSKINSAVLVEIMVSTHSDAYTLFKSLNMRGTPLTAIDLIKNTLLAKSSISKTTTIDSSFQKWSELLEYIGDDYTLQERFFRHYYNAFKEEINESFKTITNKYPLGTLATRSNILKIYEQLIEKDPVKFLDNILEAGKIYSYILNNNSEDEKSYQNELHSLDRIQGSPSYLLLLFLIKNQVGLTYTDELLKQTVQLLVKFFVRRNLTDMPSTRDLTKCFMDIVSNIKDKKGKDVLYYIQTKLIEVSATEAEFIDKLNGPVYDLNIGTTRFILCYIAEQFMTKEIYTDLWKLDNNRKYIWTIEHIFPQGDNIPKDWVDMIADGNQELAKEYKAQYVHTLGNLTITGYNSTLGTKSFIEKRDRVDRNGKLVGYKNGIILNQTIEKKSEWKIDNIKERTQELVALSLKLFNLK